jgi:FlaA1/EpsC-like NDP-sugar epimerase
MIIPEAAQLLLQACSMGSVGEIFVLDMGNPVKIVASCPTIHSFVRI